jgi:hypothetical protein
LNKFSHVVFSLEYKQNNSCLYTPIY